MAANAYYAPASRHDHYDQQHQRLLSSGLSSPGMRSPGYPPSGHSSPLKPLHLVNEMDAHGQKMDELEEIKRVKREDALLKSRIRRLRLISRVLALIISIVVFVPITLTLHKFLTTRNIYHDVTLPDGTVKSRTAWARESKVWPTYMYFGVATTALVLNLGIIVAYLCSGVEKANTAALVSTIFSWCVMIGNVIVWTIAASLYRTEKDTGEKPNDLWGWTCSVAAKKIQKEFANEVDFNKFCNTQSASWYAGLAQAGAAILTVVIYLMVWQRRKAKKLLKVQRARRSGGFASVKGSR
ncbi:hypothetical protein P154DRAFT_527370 [Amniculicola lignicola CBS 123094]|uniref:MARVEL domain-containing protein n=1 Tax=Amniculicola lignicola CBS 123094 TaxID=1392246 RepID=A0A6A5VYD7_9PLEO|nr:hypothetical protein P154DRAFT_527370 [Amniculicola lignicola CBS 123094]